MIKLIIILILKLERGIVMTFIDLRSDTVTQPTLEMRKAMANSIVGDDVYEDDPTVNELEKMAADMVGKEAALFVPSGTMGNQIAIMTHTKFGDEIIVNAKSHIVKYEVGAAARLSGVSYSIVDNPDGRIHGNNVHEKVRGVDIHYPETGLLCLENALTDGTVVSLELMKEAYEAAKEHNIPVHTDGARIFNAAVSLGVDVKELTQYTDSVMFCLSKGLCSPVGSLLCGSKEFINKARKNRKILGGGMRQAGVLAACGLISLNTMAKRLKEDHDNAKYFAAELVKFPFIKLDMETVQINMVFFKIEKDGFDSSDFAEYMLNNNIKISANPSNEFRFVTNNDVKREQIDIVLNTMNKYFS